MSNECDMPVNLKVIEAQKKQEVNVNFLLSGSG